MRNLRNSTNNIVNNTILSSDDNTYDNKETTGYAILAAVTVFAICYILCGLINKKK